LYAVIHEKEMFVLKRRRQPHAFPTTEYCQFLKQQSSKLFWGLFQHARAPKRHDTQMIFVSIIDVIVKSTANKTPASMTSRWRDVYLETLGRGLLLQPQQPINIIQTSFISTRCNMWCAKFRLLSLPVREFWKSVSIWQS